MQNENLEKLNTDDFEISKLQSLLDLKTDDNYEFFGQLIQTYIDQFNLLWPQATEANKTGDFKKLRHMMHQLGGINATIGVTSLYHKCRDGMVEADNQKKLTHEFVTFMEDKKKNVIDQLKNLLTNLHSKI